MFEGKTILEVISMGGFTMYVLIGCSVLLLGIFLERIIAYRRKSIDRAPFMGLMQESISKGEIGNAIKRCETVDAPLATVALAALRHSGREEKIIANAAEREIMLQTAKLEKLTSIVGTIGNIAVYIGLFGTVLGIVRSFHSMSQIGSGGISVVIGGVAEALICTAAGLSVAIPAVVVHNYFTRRVDGFVMDMECCASEITDLLTMRRDR